MPRSRVVPAAACLAVLAACAPRFDPNDPTVIATIDSIMQSTMDAAAQVDADRVLSIAADDLTFLTGEVLLSGLEPIRARFKETYAGLKSQQMRVLEKHTRLLSPDVAVVTAVSEGTYTDQAGWTAPQVGIGTTIVFVREEGQWKARHVHQSISY